MDFDIKKILEYSDRKNDVIEKAANALCEHFQCQYEDLILERTSNFDHQILRKADKAKGLAFLIKRVFGEDSVQVIAEPIYFNREEEFSSSPKPKEEESPKTHKALDGINTITTYPDGTEVSTLIHPVNPSPKPPTKDPSEAA